MEPKIDTIETLQVIEEFLNEASTEEKEVLKGLVEALKKKRGKKISSYITSLLGFEGKMHDDGMLEMTMPITPISFNTLNMTHGGITATLLDTVMGTLANRVLPEHKGAVTSEIKINYLAPGVGSFIRSEARVVHQGKKVIVVEGKAFSDKGNLIALATGSFFVIEKR